MDRPMAASFTRPICVVDLVGYLVDLLLQAVPVLDQPLQGQGLDGEGHVHDLRRVAVARRQVDQPPLGRAR